MEYFRTLNFDREPFSNSPDPVLFYSSRQHMEALQQLEIAIRLKRGLNLITGDVGTGKTTLCRQLIQRINQDPGIEYHLILDAAFTSTSDFLNSILKFFTGARFLGCDDNHLKEEIKNYLYSRGVDDDKVVVLMIDEGQKLPDFCLEILRELLNYETNHQKLLQIVIFAQKELESIIEPLENFVDRINFRYELHPLNFAETKGLIQYRVNASFPKGYRATIFTRASFFAIFHFTRGYPRKIIHLCHHALLALIVQNKSRAGFFFIRECALKAGNPRRTTIGLLPAAVAACMLLISVFLFDFPDISAIQSHFFSNADPTLISQAGLPRPQKTLPTTDASKPALPETQAALQADDPLPPDPGKTRPAIETVQPAINTTQAAIETVQPVLETRTPEPPEQPATPKLVYLAPVKKQTPAQVFPDPETAGPEKAEKPGFGFSPTQLQAPAFYGTIYVPKFETLSKISEHIYGTFNMEKLAILQQHNPQLANPNQLSAGTPLVFPVLPDVLNEWKPDDFCIVLAQENTFSMAYAKARKLENRAYTVRLLPFLKSSDQPLSFYIVINRPYASMQKAEQFRAQHVEIIKAYSVQISSIARNFTSIQEPES